MRQEANAQRLLRIRDARARTMGLDVSALDAQVEEKNKISIDRNFRLLNFYPDGYCKETNTIYEIYEQYHKSDRYLKRDDIRRRIIQNYLKCDFVIIWDNKDRTTEFYKYV